MGLGFLGLLVFFLGALHLLYPIFLQIMVAGFAVAGIYFSAFRLRALGRIRAGAWLEAALVLVFGAIIIVALVHPTRFYAALTYHLALPRQYLLRNSIVPIPSISYSYFPEIAEML